MEEVYTQMYGKIRGLVDEVTLAHRTIIANLEAKLKEMEEKLDAAERNNYKLEGKIRMYESFLKIPTNCEECGVKSEDSYIMAYFLCDRCRQYCDYNEHNQ